MAAQTKQHHTVFPGATSKRIVVLPQLATRIFDRLVMYYQRSRQRRALQKLDDYALKDIGISRANALREANKPFWVE